MTSCDEFRPSLMQYHLGLLEGPARDAADAHVSGCAACLAKYLETKRLHEDAAAFDERPAEAVREKLRAAVAARRRPARPRWATWAASAAAAAALVAVLRAMLPPLPPEPLPPPDEAPGLIDSTAAAREDRT